MLKRVQHDVVLTKSEQLRRGSALYPQPSTLCYNWLTLIVDDLRCFYETS